MINTIFYFVDTEQEYQAKLSSGEIKPYTIVFVRDTRAIWKNGIRYSGFTEDEIKQIIELETEDINAAIELINNTIDEINQQISDEKDRLDDVVDGLDSEIQDKVEDLFADSQWIQNNQPQGLVVPYDMSWDNNIQAYLQRVGLWDYNDASIVTKWSTIRQSLNSIQSDVNSITETGGALDLLQSQITQEVTDRGDAITNLGNTYARITDVNGVKDVIEWMYSGLKSGSGADKTYAEIMAAGKNGMNSAISDLRTSIENIDDTYVAKSSLTSAVNDAISGVVNTTAEGQAMSSMFSKIDENSDDIAAIATKVTGDSSQATVAAKINGMTASLVTTANLDSSIAALSAQAKDTVGNAIAATIFAKANEQGSTITLNADKINIDANHQLDLSAQTIAVNADDINIDANHQLDLTSQVIILRADKVSFQNSAGNLTTPAIWIDSNNGTLHAVNGDFSGKIVAGEGSIGGFVIGTNNIHSTAVDSNSNPLIQLNNDGSARLGGLVVANNGDATLTGTINATGGSITGDISVGQTNGLHVLITPNNSTVTSNSISWTLSKGIQFYNGNNYQGGLQYVGNDLTLVAGINNNIRIDSSGITMINSGSTYNYIDTTLNNLSAWTEWKYNDTNFLRIGVARGKIYGYVSSASDFKTSSEAYSGELYLDNGFLKIK